MHRRSKAGEVACSYALPQLSLCKAVWEQDFNDVSDELHTLALLSVQIALMSGHQQGIDDFRSLCTEFRFKVPSRFPKLLKRMFQVSYGVAAEWCCLWEIVGCTHHHQLEVGP